MNRKLIGIETDDNNRPPAYIKNSNNDFIVCEVTERGIMPLIAEQRANKNSGTGLYRLFNLTKNGYTTQDAISEVANQIGVRKEAISYHGMKDKNAVTTQSIAVLSALLAPSYKFYHRNIFLYDLGLIPNPLRRGGNVGNFFQIKLVTNDKWVDLSKIEKVYNFFGHQRFGAFMDEQNIGRFLLTGLYEDAAKKIIFFKQKKLFESVLGLCEGDYEQAFFHPMFRQSTRFCIMQWQSFLFNKLMSQYIKRGMDLPDHLPLWSPGENKVYKSVWGYRGKINQKMAKMTAKTKRKTIFSPQKLNLSSDNNSITLQFQIPSGCYATVALEQLFNIKERRYE